MLSVGLTCWLVHTETRLGLKINNMSWFQLVLIETCLLVAVSNLVPPPTDKSKKFAATEENTQPTLHQRQRPMSIPRPKQKLDPQQAAQ